jgi:transposase InsO family protein
MPWEESCLVNERMRFVTRLETGERMSELCREYGISRKTGYKFWDRYKKKGPKGLFDEPRKPITSPFQTPEAIQKLILDLKAQKPSWGADKLKSYLEKRRQDIRIPSRGSIYTLLCRNGLVQRRKQRSGYKNEGTHIPETKNPNEIWCTDFKGEFLLGNQKYCYPLTISDHFSRLLISCEGLENTKTNGVQTVFESVFQEYGLPDAILSDNGTPFGAKGLFGFSQLSLWWLRLGIKILRIKPGHPEQNGRHERMHLTLKQQTVRPPGQNFLQQQEKFDRFKNEYNTERPHAALSMKCPSDVYQSTRRAYPTNLGELKYPLHDLTRTVLCNGFVVSPSSRNKRFFLGQAFRNQRVGLREQEAGLWAVSFANWDLGLLDLKNGKFSPFHSPEPSGGST